MVCKRYTDEEKPLPPACEAACYDCGLLYSDPGWSDVVVPDHVWETINPTHHRGCGLLCFNCIARRCVESMIVYTQIKITSGPFSGYWK